MADYLPTKPETLTGWLDRFNLYLNGNYERLGLTADDLQRVDLVNLGWASAYNDQVAAAAAYKGKTDMRNNKQVEVGEVIRPIVKRIQACPNTTDADRAAMEITVYNRDNTPAEIDLGFMECAPSLAIETGTRLRHKIKVQNKTGDGTRYGKPAGATGCEIFRKIGSAPASESEMEFVDVATRANYAIDYTFEDGQKQVYYKTRWINSKGQKGPWSETTSATIAA